MLNKLSPEVRTVDGIRRLMKQLCEALDALSEGVSIAAPDTVRGLLSMRHGIVPVVDEQLTKCAELIRRGLRDEAASYAFEFPDLIQVATLLDLSGHSRWKVWLAKLTELNIPAPPIPRMDLVAGLTRAQDELVQLKPYLDAWRRMNLGNAPLTDRIAMLKKLRRADPENELWFESLREHQKHRIPELEQAVAIALKSQDDKQLHALVGEMQEEWIEPVPHRIISAARKGLEKFQRNRLERELTTVASSLSAAHDARDRDAAQTLREQWQELVDAIGSFAIDDPNLAAAAAAVDWVDAHSRMTAVSEEIWSSLDARPRGLRARQDWLRSLERLGNEMEDLAERLEGDADDEAIERAHDRIGRQREMLDRDLRFRRMVMYVGIASTVAVIGVIVWYFDDQSRHERRVAAALRDLQAAQEKVARGVLQDLPDFRATWPARISTDPQVSSLLAIVQDELDQQSGRRTRLATALTKGRDSLRVAESSERPDPFQPWPQAYADASRSLAEIENAKLAISDQEQADAARFKADLNRLGKRLVAAADARCRELIAGFDSDLEKARGLLNTDAKSAIGILKSVKTAVAALHEQIARPAATDASSSHASLRIASEPVVSQLSPTGAILKKAEAIDGMLANRNEFRESVQALDRSLGDWERYAKQLEDISRKFTKLLEARDYSRAAECKAQWQAVDSWQHFQPWLKQLLFASPEQAEEIITKFEGLSKETKKLRDARRFADDILPAIKQLSERDLGKLRAELELWFSGPWVGELKFVVIENNTTYYCLAGHPEGEGNFIYVSGQKDAGAGWPTKKNWKKAEKVEQSPQSRLADKLREVVRAAKPDGGIAVDELFVALLETVVGAEDMDPIPRLVTARKILVLASEYSRPCREAGRPLMALLDDGAGNIPGISIDQIWSFVPPSRDENPDYQVTKQKAARLIAEIRRSLGAIKQAVAEERLVLTTPPQGVPNLVGRLGRDEAGELVAVWQKSAPVSGEVWWFPAGADATVAGTVDEKGDFRPSSTTGPAGTPLYTMASESKEETNSRQQTAAGEAK